MKALNALTVDFDPIEHSMRDLSRLFNDFYINKNTGKVFAISRALIRYLAEEIYKEQEDLPEWDAAMIPLARQIVVKGSADYVRIPEAFGCPEHTWMAEFEKDVRSPKLKQ